MAKVNVDELCMGITFHRCSECERVEVISCGRCIYHDHDSKYCNMWDHLTLAEDFCSSGEKEEAWEDWLMRIK